MEYRRLLKYEHDIFEKFTNRIIISEPDRELIPHPDRDKIVVVANGVDTDFFRPVQRPREYDLVFTGNMGYPPNINAAEFLVNRILPILTRHKPDIRLLIAGSSPNMRVLVLKSPQVEVSGWVPDMRDCYASAKIFIAPMQLGTGLQNKLLEAMAMKVPCITSPLANQALMAREGEEILVADTPQAYADRILSLLGDPSLCDRIGEKGYLFVRKNYNWEVETQKIESLILKH
jgi:glycosyltransferase involved in cell wall biosynthesis